MEDVRAVHTNFQIGRLHLIKEPSCFLGRIDHVRDFRFKRKHHLVFLGDRQCLLHRFNEIAPRFWCIVIRVCAPHTVGVPRASTDRNHGCPHRSTLLRDRTQHLQSGVPFLNIGIDHIVGAPKCRDRDLSVVYLLANLCER